MTPNRWLEWTSTSWRPNLLPSTLAVTQGDSDAISSWRLSRGTVGRPVFNRTATLKDTWAKG